MFGFTIEQSMNHVYVHFRVTNRWYKNILWRSRLEWYFKQYRCDLWEWLFQEIYRTLFLKWIMVCSVMSVRYLCVSASTYQVYLMCICAYVCILIYLALQPMNQCFKHLMPGFFYFSCLWYVLHCQIYCPLTTCLLRGKEYSICQYFIFSFVDMTK